MNYPRIRNNRRFAYQAQYDAIMNQRYGAPGNRAILPWGAALTGAANLARYGYKKWYGASKPQYREWKTKSKVLSQIKRRGTQASMKRKLKKLERYNNSSMGTLIYRDIEIQDLRSTPNLTANQSYFLNDITSLELALAQLRYYDPTAPTNLVTADFSTGSYQKEALIEASSLSLIIKANYKIPVNVCVYQATAREDTSLTIDSLLGSALADMCNLSGQNEPYTYPSDFPLVTDLWKINKTIKRRLLPGQAMKVSISSKGTFNYDPSVSDVHALVYQRKNKARTMFVRIYGDPGHDTSVDEQGLVIAQVDILSKRTYKIKYNAGADINYVYVNKQLDTFTNQGLTCMVTVPVNGIAGLS